MQIEFKANKMDKKKVNKKVNKKINKKVNKKINRKVNKKCKPKLLAPAGNFIALRAALDAGADEIYFGVKGFNMRAGAQNFTVSDMKKVVGLCHDRGAKAYLALNIILYESEMKKADKVIDFAKKAGVDAIIAWDMSVIEKARSKGIDVHLSTQASISNYEALESYKKRAPKLKRVILARECLLDDIKKIIAKIKKNKLDIEIETFVHGAMCVSVSGRCFLSQEMFCKSANRGECLQPCRRNYKTYVLKDPEEGHELLMGEDYVMSPKDLCTLPFIEKLIDSGISCLKIEGRNRNPEYVAVVVSCYRTIIDYYWDYKARIKKNGSERKQYEVLKRGLVQKLKSVYHRGFSSGFFMGKPIKEWSQIYGSKATEYKQYVGKVVNYYSKIGVAEIKAESYPANLGDKIIFLGPTTGVVTQKLNEIMDSRGSLKAVKKGMTVTIKTVGKVRKNDLMYKVVNRK